MQRLTLKEGIVTAVVWFTIGLLLAALVNSLTGCQLTEQPAEANPLRKTGSLNDEEVLRRLFYASEFQGIYHWGQLEFMKGNEFMDTSLVLQKQIRRISPDADLLSISSKAMNAVMDLYKDDATALEGISIALDAYIELIRTEVDVLKSKKK